MQSISNITRAILDREGGYVNDPDDPGGATHHGITLATLQRLNRDINADGVVNIEDVRQLSVEVAADILEAEYFHRPNIGALPSALQSTVYDMYVNAGSQAVRLLQRLLVTMGEEIAVDGVIGPMTIAAVEHAVAMVGADLLADAYGVERRNFYYRLADRRAPLRKFARRSDGRKGGWILRAEEFISPKYHFTPEEHRRRVAAWD